MHVPVGLLKIAVIGGIAYCQKVQAMVILSIHLSVFYYDGSVADSICFQGTGVDICCDGCRYLGSAVGTNNFVCFRPTSDLV